jgi:serpin B
MWRPTARLATCCVTLAAMLGGLAMAPQAAAQDIQALTLAYNTSGLELLQRLAVEPGNLVLSPYSIGTAMAMARSGARGVTETEMAGVLRHRLDRAGTDAANAGLLKVLNGYDGSAAPTCERGLAWTGQRCEAAARDGRCPETARREGERCIADPTFLPPSARLLAANALVLAGKEETVSADYLRLVADSYRAEVFAEAGLAQVNDWVSSKTEGMIPKMLEQLGGNAVLLNAVYFKAHWAQRFDERATRDDAFHLTADRRIDVPMMRHTGRYELVARPGYRAIRLPYDVPALSVIVVLPDQIDGLADLVGRFDARELLALTAALESVPANLVALTLPRFKAGSRNDLAYAFSQLGMRAAFDRHQADFSGITGRPPSQGRLVIDEIVHRAVIDVMEEGTEAAAATAVEMAPETAAAPRRPEQPEPFVVDHPFLFLIVDRASEAVLFAGRIAEPR